MNFLSIFGCQMQQQIANEVILGRLTLVTETDLNTYKIIRFLQNQRYA
jgi:hypothetical protein